MSSDNKHLADKRLASHCMRNVEFYVNKARALGYIITVHNEPNAPLAMGNHTSVVEMRPAHSTYRDKSDTTVTKEPQGG